MKNLLITILFNFFVFFSFANAQDISKILPLNATRQDIIKYLGEGQKVNESKTIYDLPEQKLIVYSYADSCTEDFLKKYELTKDTLMSLTIFPKMEIKVDSRQMVKLYKSFELLNDKKAYLDWSNIILTKSKNTVEFTEIIYHFPQTLWSDSCSRNYLDEDSGIELFNELTKPKPESPNAPINSGMYFSGDSILTKENTISWFCQTLNESPQGEGQIQFFLRKNDSKTQFAFYKKHLSQKLQKNKCNLSRVKFVKQGTSPNPDEAFFIYQVFRKKPEIPK